jgi:predicted glycoside hydrolase/deacetylase ChbG (UPF0249 family)
MTAARLLLLTLLVVNLAMLASPVVYAQQAGNATAASLVERLGYPPEARLLLVHMDDIGVAHSVNEASIAAFETGLVPSGSIMVPCPWFPEIAAYAREHPDVDLGLHLTLTSEWKHYRWGTVLPASEVPTLLDAQGFLYATTEEAVQHMDVGETEAEIRAQVERALAFGIQPTHLDAHMGTLFQTPALFEAYLRVGRDYRIPVFVPGDALRQQAPHLMDLLTPDDVVLDHFAMAGPQVPAEGWDAFYTRLLENLQPGVTEIIIHAALDDAEMRAVTVDHPDYGAAWRQRDFDFFTSDAFKQLLEQHDVQLITWREIGKLLK